MVDFRNASGCPLSSDNWLDNHHTAKLSERRQFAQRIAKINPDIVVDLGCGTGLWLDIIHDLLPKKCQIIGIDSDQGALDRARDRSIHWSRQVSFIRGNIEDSDFQIPFADVYLCFNLFGYISNVDLLIERIKYAGKDSSTTVVRQYDGSLMRFGPLHQTERHKIDGSLLAGIGFSKQFRHYEIDRTLSAIRRCSYPSKIIEFENFLKFSPFSIDLERYILNTIEWMSEIIDNQSTIALREWLIHAQRSGNYYVLETDLVSVLS